MMLLTLSLKRKRVSQNISISYPGKIRRRIRMSCSKFDLTFIVQLLLSHSISIPQDSSQLTMNLHDLLKQFHRIAIYTNKIDDCLFIYLFVYLSICSAIGGQTARPKRLKFGG